jgi:iron(III) transport system substrate-binding protein
VVVVAGLLAACAPAAAPDSGGRTRASAEAAQEVIAVAATPVSVAATGSASRVAPPADWEAQWQRTLAAARQEGRLSLIINAGDLYRAWVMEFEKAYPGIAVETIGLVGRDAVPRVLQEQRQGQYLWDAYVGGPNSAQQGLKPEGALDPLRPSLLLPEILDDSKWYGGFDFGFTDLEDQYIYAHRGDVSYSVYVNRDFVSEAELSRIEDLTDPKWKGKISWQEPTLQGNGAVIAAHFLLTKGEEWYRSLFAQDIVPTREARQQVEFLARGRYPIAIGVSNEPIEAYRAQGVGLNIVPLAPTSEAGSRLGMGIAIAAFAKPPHPNAAKVFLNWALSRDGQTKWVQIMQNQGTRRLDVPVPPELALDPQAKFPLSVNKEEAVPILERAIDVAREYVQ